MPLHLAAIARVSSSQIGEWSLVLIWEIEVGEGGKVLTVGGKCPPVRDRKQLGCESQLSCSMDENSQQIFFCILGSEYYTLGIWSCCPGI